MVQQTVQVGYKSEFIRKIQQQNPVLNFTTTGQAEEFTLEESMNDIKTIELDTKVDPEDATKVNVTFSINGKVYYSGKKHNAFDLDGHKGVIFYSDSAVHSHRNVPSSLSR